MKNQDKPGDVLSSDSSQYAKDQWGIVLGSVMEAANMEGKVVDLEVLTRVALRVGFEDGLRRGKIIGGEHV